MFTFRKKYSENAPTMIQKCSCSHFWSNNVTCNAKVKHSRKSGNWIDTFATFCKNGKSGNAKVSIQLPLLREWFTFAWHVGPKVQKGTLLDHCWSIVGASFSKSENLHFEHFLSMYPPLEFTPPLTVVRTSQRLGKNDPVFIGACVAPGSWQLGCGTSQKKNLISAFFP